MRVNVYVDTSLKEAAADVALAFLAANPWARVVPLFAPAGDIADRMRRGEDADLVLLPAGLVVRRLAEERLITRDTVTVLGLNPLVFAGREGSKARRMGDLPALSRIVAAAPGSSPSGEFAVEALRSGRVEEEVGSRFAATASDGREALSTVAKGEADGAFAFRSDAAATEGTRILFVVPRSLYPPPEVILALTPGAGSNDAALCLFRFLRSEQGKRSLSRQGIETAR